MKFVVKSISEFLFASFISILVGTGKLFSKNFLVIWIRVVH